MQSCEDEEKSTDHCLFQDNQRSSRGTGIQQVQNRTLPEHSQGCSTMGSSVLTERDTVPLYPNRAALTNQGSPESPLTTWNVYSGEAGLQRDLSDSSFYSHCFKSQRYFYLLFRNGCTLPLKICSRTWFELILLCRNCIRLNPKCQSMWLLLYCSNW